MGCGCKKRNQPVTDAQVTVQLTEGSSSQPPQQVTIMEQQVNDLVRKIEDINNQIDETPTT
jgi:peptidoglycan hydrolase CwlO-like protein